MENRKCRAWDPSSKKMWYDFLISSSTGTAFFNDRPQHNWIVMDFSGKRDKRGEYIYAGDKVKRFNGNVYEVIYFDGAFHLRGSKPLYEVSGELEVIGNIYEKQID